MLLNRVTNFCHFKKIKMKSSVQTYVLNELQWLSMCVSGKQSNRLTDIASLRPSLTYQKIVVNKMLKLFSNITGCAKKSALIIISTNKTSIIGIILSNLKLKLEN